MDIHKIFDEIEQKYLEKLPFKQRIEIGAVLHYLENENKSVFEFEIEKLNIKPEEPADIIYDGRKFQVTMAPADVSKMVGILLSKKEKVKVGHAEGWYVNVGKNKIPFWTSGGSVSEWFEDSIIKPIQKKRNQYGSEKSIPEALKNIILLIYSNNEPVCPWSDNLWDDFKNENKNYFSTTGFHEIYLIDQKNNLKIYP